MLESTNDPLASGNSGPKTLLQEWFGDWGGKLTAAFGVFLIFHVLYLVFQWGSQEYQALSSNLITLVIYAGPCIIAWRASMHPMLSARAARAWRLVSLANLSFLVGNVLWIYFENYLGEQPFPSWADAGYLAFYPLMFVGLLSLVDKFRSGEERLNFWLDSSVVAIGGSMVVWYFLIRPMAASHDGDMVKTLLTIGYPVGDLVVLLGVSSLLMRRTGFSNEWPVNFLLIGCVVNFAADFTFSYQNLQGTYVSGGPMDALFTLACYPVMLGAHMQWIVASRNETSWRPIHQTSTRNFWVPYLAVAVVYLVRVAVVFEAPTEPLDSMIAVTGVVTALVIIRQFMFVRENTKANLALSELQERVQGIFSASTDAIGLADFNGTLTEVNDSFIRLTGYRRDQIVGTMKYQEFVPDNSFETSNPPERGNQFEFERELVRKDGSKRSVTTTLYPVHDAAGQPAAMAVVVRDITDRRALEEQLTHQAMHDSLTGLANRTLLQNRVAAALSRAKRRNSRIAVLFIDLDNFKTVNDTLGHAAGDILLVNISDRLRKCLRLSDTPARLGGDEFAVLLEDFEDETEKELVAARLLDEIRRPVDIQGREVFVGASIGIAANSPADQPEDLLRKADVAMYTAKRSGKNCYSVFADAMHEAVVKRAQLEGELRTALERNEFRLKYQPIIELGSGRVAGVEALLRWAHPRGIEIGPDEFIPIAEETNMISSIGKFVLHEACSRVSMWNRSAGGERLSVSVNISTRQFMEDDFVNGVIETCEATGTLPSDLTLEITERIMLLTNDSTMKKLNEIRQLGIKLAVDDFGTGYSSLSYLNKFPVDVLKIDRSFVEMLSISREGEAMARAIVSMGETLNLTTIAEGIEDADQSNMLTSIGCDLGQGYYFAKPLDPEELEAYLQLGSTIDQAEHDGDTIDSGRTIGYPEPLPALS